jgi:ankyrin repeat protein
VADYLITTHTEDVNAPGCSLGDPLHMASARGHTEIVYLLLQHNADVNYRCSGYYGWTPLHFATYLGHAKVVQLLLEHGADVNAQSLSHSTPLYFASTGGHLEVVRLLLGYGADVHIRSDLGDTLRGAQSGGHVEVAQILLEHGAVTKQDSVASLQP